MTSPTGAEHDTSRCPACDARLAHDQRYCVRCGARRGALPRRLAAAVAGILEQGETVTCQRGPVVRSEEHERGAHGPAALPEWMPSPRAAAAAVLCMLGAGALVGSVMGTGLASTVTAPLRIIVSLGSAVSSVVQGDSGGGSGGQAGAALAAGSSRSQPPTAGAAQQQPLAIPLGGATTSLPGAGVSGLPPIKHVFVVMLADQGYKQTFGSTAPYFAKTLAKQGALVPNYYGVTAGELANGIALISGQGPTAQTAADCPRYENLAPAKKGARGQVLGSGCVYPPRAETLADELATARLSWRAYIDGMDRVAAGARRSCVHPPIGRADPYHAPGPGRPYVTWRNPFVYFHSLIDGTACKRSDVPLSALARDLRTAKTTPALSYVAPSPCEDGSDQPCSPGAHGGLGPAIKFLGRLLPRIERSPAYKADGLIVITFDEAPQSGPHADNTSCCNAHGFPNLPSAPGATTPGGSTTATPGASTTTTPGASTTTTPASPVAPPGGVTSPAGAGQPPGGGQVGMVAISRFVKPGTLDLVDSYNHFSLLATIEKLFGLARLGYASDPGVQVLGPSVFTAYP